MPAYEPLTIGKIRVQSLDKLDENVCGDSAHASVDAMIECLVGMNQFDGEAIYLAII